MIMKKARIFLGTMAVLVAVGGTVAFKSARTNHNLNTCNVATGKCVTSLIYSTINNGSPVSVTAYTGAAGQTCNTSLCPLFTGQVYNNQ
jgi:hypothetical protein